MEFEDWFDQFYKDAKADGLTDEQIYHIVLLVECGFSKAEIHESILEYKGQS